MKQILITGICGEVGHALVSNLQKYRRRGAKIVGLDVFSPNDKLASQIDKFYKTSITNKPAIKKLIGKHNFDVVYHLASILSTGAEKHPYKAHQINVEGMAYLLESLVAKNQNTKKKVKFIFPSSIAVYGIANMNQKNKFSRVTEEQFNNPITIYGINKLYCENLGKYYDKHYKLLENNKGYIDFRCIRFPGLLSAETIPSGGTSDYGPEMLHMSAQGKSYKCFVNADTKIPFMAMPDAARSLLEISKAPKSKLNHNVYNISGFSITASGIKNIIEGEFQDAKIEYRIDNLRQNIVNSWPEDVNDLKARKDWKWKPNYNFQKTFKKYLFPKIKEKYNTKNTN